MRKVSLALGAGVAIAGLALALSGCSSPSGTDGATSAPTSSGDASGPVESIVAMLPADVQQSKTITVGARNDAPLSTSKDASGNVTGYEVDIMAELSKILGVTYQTTYVDTNSLIPGLQSNRFQAAYGAYGTNADRQQVVDFVDWSASPLAYVGLASKNLKVSTLDDLCGLTVASAQGTQAASLAQAQVATCAQEGKPVMTSNTYATTNDYLLAVKSGHADVAFTTIVTAMTASQADPTLQDLGPDTVLPSNTIGLSFLKGSDLTPAFAAAINYLIQQEPDVYQGILDKWGLPADCAITQSEINPAK